jgi:hypothetical protein
MVGVIVNWGRASTEAHFRGWDTCANANASKLCAGSGNGD